MKKPEENRKQISRRDFLKGVGAGALTLGAMSVVPAMASESSSSLPTIDGNQNPPVDLPTISGNKGTPKKKKQQQKKVPYKTTSSTPPAAPVPPAAPSTPVVPKDAQITIQTEVVIVGAGNAGCAAASSCVDNGNAVIVLEQQNVIHGQGGGIGKCNTKFVEQLVEEGKLEHDTDVELHQNIWIQRCGSRVKESLVTKWFAEGPETGEWLIDKCAEYGVFPVSFRAHAPNAMIPESYDYHMFFSDGSYQFSEQCGYFMATNVLYTDSINAEKHENPATYFFNTKAIQLYVDKNGRVAGVYAVKEGKNILFLASKGVILATGGIHEDEELVAEYCDENVYRVARCEHGPVGFSTGDGHKMSMQVGAKMQDGPFPLMLHPQANAMFHGCFPFLNTDGERFMNEGTWVQGKSMNILRQKDSIAWSIFDKNWAHYNTLSLETGEGGGMFWDTMGAQIGDPFTDEDLVATVEADIANGNTIKADTLEELAEKTGIPYAAMKASLDRYNELVAKGVDEDFRKPKVFLYPVEEGPFYAAKVGIALLAIVGGIMVNDELNALDENDEPIPGLYVTGNTSGGLYAVDYPINMAGNSNGRCVIWGHSLGKTMAEIPSNVTLTDIATCGVDPAPISGAVVSDLSYKDGTYEGSGEGRNGEITVQVTIASGKIADIVCTVNNESEDIGGPAIEKLIPAMVAANGTAVDAVAGATMSYNGLKQAVDAALAQAQQ